MGFIRTDRGALCCDVCLTSPARKIKCPYGYCQATASCADCKPKVKALDHSNCKARMEEIARDKQALSSGTASLTLYACKSSFEDKTFWRIREDGPSFAACCIFNKTWVDAPDIEQLRAWGNTITFESEVLNHATTV